MPAEETPSAAWSVWSGLLAAAGVVAGFGALVYLIGAATLWLALRSSGYSSDVGIEHQPRSQLIGLGLRGIFFVAMLTLFLGLLAAAIVRWAKDSAASVRFRHAAAATVVLLVGASWMKWRWFALAIAVSTLVLAIAFYLRLPAYRRRWQVFLVVAAAVLTTLSWTYGGPVYVNAVAITPARLVPLDGVFSARRWKEMCTIAGTSRASRYTYVDGRLIWIAEANPCRYRPSQSLAKIVAAFRRRCALPYFGESDALVYVGGVRNVYAPDPDTCLWDSSGAIVELRRGKVHLQFERARAFLNRRRRRPIAAAWKTFDSFLERLGLPH